jgi:NTP pyrophosphatase (non-canonical NTP hydrolase)
MSPINKFQQLAAITAEECGELTQVCMKLLRRFDRAEDLDEKYKNKLIEEAGDVLCMIELMVEHRLLTNDELGARVNVKREKLKQWSQLIK